MSHLENAECHGLGNRRAQVGYASMPVLLERSSVTLVYGLDSQGKSEAENKKPSQRPARSMIEIIIERCAITKNAIEEDFAKTAVSPFNTAKDGKKDVLP